MNWDKFQFGTRAYKGADKDLGFPALAALREARPEFIAFTGDNVYYDHGVPAFTERSMRRKWRRTFSFPRMVELMAEVPAYWQKDDHDYRYNDCDNTGTMPPSPRLGQRIFLEQVPVMDPALPPARPYRTHRVTRELQIWLLEGRDYRSPNRQKDGPDKTMWGLEQRKWLTESLSESDAAIKLIVSPTPLIGPDDAYKRDNHVSPEGFGHERDLFFAWAKQKGLDKKGMYIINGDRHWQYHSRHPLGFEEFSVGTLHDANARMGVAPGDKKGTDPEAEIEQFYSSPEPSGGFLLATVIPDGTGQASLLLEFMDERGKLMYRVER